MATTMGAMLFRRKPVFALLAFFAAILCACNAPRSREINANQSRERWVKQLQFGTIHAEEVTFYSNALGRRMRYIVLLPANYNFSQQRLAVLYLLHGGGPGYPENWLTSSSLIQLLPNAEWLTVLPQGDDSWYVNAALVPQDRYEDYISQDLREDVDSHYRTRAESGGRGIAGISMGGYGAIYLTLRHPNVYSFAGLFGASLDAPRRWFNFIHLHQGLREREIFGPLGRGRDHYDPFVILQNYESNGSTLCVWSTCGDHDSFLKLNRRLDRSLDSAHIRHTLVVSHGGHDWPTWNSELGSMLSLWSAWIRQ